MDLVSNIIEATTEIFQTMLMMEVTPSPPLEEEVKSYRCSVSGMIGMAGLYKGMLAIHAPDDVAKSITGSFLGMEVEEVDEDVKDAIGELANMLGGSIKLALTEQGNDIKLSIPSVIAGDEYSLECRAASDTKKAMVPFSIPGGGNLLVELQVQRQG